MTTSAGDPFAHKVYLRTLDDALLPTRYSRGAQRRAAQVQGFLRTLQQHVSQQHVSQQYVSQHVGGRSSLAAPTLLVVDRDDWRALFSYPYGFPFTRPATRSAPGVTVVVAANYPERLLRRFDEVLVRAAKAGVSAPGDLREFLDLLGGFEWGHALLYPAGLHTKAKWCNEFLAVYLYLLTLRETGQGDLFERVVAWARLGVVGSGVARAPLSAFDYPRLKLPLDTLLWFQGVFTLRAAEFLDRRAWDFPTSLAAALDDTKRRNVKPTLLKLEPDFAAWFDRFAPVETP